MAFARRLVATTDRAFVAATGTGRLARLVRTRIVPRVLPVLVRFRGRATLSCSAPCRRSPSTTAASR